ncbi:Putative translation factor (SUA5) [Citrobacter koseri]|uniref:Translation factor (SUA5) n=1 Tax=Citrobacter koseri TaxID=545 RepID=A0A3S4IB43_CITKO|nr:Putative translation factor (SUA5) [Citrobacter koseri]
MSQFFYIHPENPQQRLINQAVEIVRKGGVIVYPTDSGYALGCKIEDKGGDGAHLPHSPPAGRA